MYIKRFATTRFAGLRDIELEFDSGLNVIVGANETGKSTIINAVFALLFVNTQLKKSKKEDLEFLQQNLPYPVGDFIDGELLFSSHDQDYLLHKRWGNRSSSQLRLPDGGLLSIEDDISKVLQSIFFLGARTYENVVFARQSQLKQVLTRLRDRELTQSMGTMLRAAVMDLDGISVDKLRQKIEDQITELLKRWDYEQERPAEQKVFKTGVGIVLASYYHLDKLRLDMQQISTLEEELHRIGQQVHAGEDRHGHLKQELMRLEPLEDDIIKRAMLEPRRDAMQAQNQGLKAIAAKWPAVADAYERLGKEIPLLAEQADLVAAEEEACRASKERDMLIQTQQTVDQNKALLAHLQAEMAQIKNPGAERLGKLTSLQNEMAMTITSIKAGTMAAAIDARSDLDIWITRDLGEETVCVERTVTADGYLKIRISDLAQVEVRTGETDIAEIKREFQQAKQAFEQELLALGVADVEEARQLERCREDLEKQAEAVMMTLENILQGRDYAAIQSRIKELGGMESTRPLANILKDKKHLEERLLEKQADLRSMGMNLVEWREKFGEPGDLLEAIVSREVEIRELNGNLDKLLPLPAGFPDSEAFRQHLREVRREIQDLDNELRILWKNYDEVERSMPEESLEEIQQQYRSAQGEFARNLRQAHHWKKMEAAFRDTWAEFASNPLQPLEEAFGRYLARITRGSYQTGLIAENFEVKVVRRDDSGWPANLLSSGTYDCVALALRFALLEQIFPGQAGFTLLDDCLVDLDPERRDQAIQIIQEYARQNQVIFTTCNRGTAQLMGGRVIELGY